MRIAIAGTGYVGLSMAVLLAQHNTVTAVDIVPEKADLINRRISPIADSEIQEYLSALPADVSPDSDTSDIESTSEDTRALTLSVVNMCGIEVGMVAVIDPVTGEQVNLDSLSDQESISMEADWPSSVNEFQWALYNTDGELCVEGTTDISSAQTTVTLLLTGDGDLEKVEELFE